jgi:hypothetical protein
MFSREKVRPKIVGLTRGKKAEAFEHPQNSSKSKDVGSSGGGAIVNVGSQCRGSIIV